MNALKEREILLVDDNPADLDLFRDAIAPHGPKPRVHTACDGEQAIAFLYRSGQFAAVARPDLIILDLNLPRRDGRSVLACVKSDPALRLIPIVMFTTSESSRDIADCYALGANCYVTKPGCLDDFRKAVRSIGEFWLGVARLCP